jgi:acyl-CoA thioester hydrolase
MEINYAFPYQIRVRYSDTDKMGYCYYGNYASFLEIGRVEALRSLGLSYKTMEESGVMMPVLELKVKYLAPALYDDLLTIQTIVTKIEGTRIYFDYEIFNEKGKKLVIAHTVLVFVNANTMRPTAPSEEFINILRHAIQ